MNSFAEFFKGRILSPRLEEVYQKFLIMRRKCKYSIFVEGSLDKKFYQNFLYNRLDCSFRGDIYPLICDGKDGVIDISNYLFEHNYLDNKTKNIINIVDRDFNSLSDYECRIKDKISVTKYYSLESYAFIKYNMDIVLNYLNLTSEKKVLFYDNFERYLALILDYESLLRFSIQEHWSIISTQVFENARLNIEKNIDIENLFKNEVDQKISSLSQSNYEKFKMVREMLQKNYLFYRGHDLEKYFDFIMNYFKIDVTLESLLSKEEVIKKFKIELEIK